MSHHKIILTLISLSAVLTSFSIRASDKTPLVHNQNLIQEAFINIDSKKIVNWSETERGSQITLPWFDGAVLPVTIEDTETSDKYKTLSGKIKAEFMGSVNLTIGKDVLTGVIVKDGESYRLRSVGDGLYSLVEINQKTFSYRDDAMTRSNKRAQIKNDDYNYKNKKKETPSTIEILEYVENGHHLTDKLYRVEDGSRIDILLAYTSEAANWAQRNGLDIDAEINNMMDLTNKSLGYSGVQVFLHRVGTVQVDHTVLDPLEFVTDINELTTGITFQDLRLMRSQLKADLVSLLVFNGEQGCNTTNGLACGVAWTPSDFMQPIDFKEYGFGEQSFLFGQDGFSVVNIYNAFNGYLFMHEIGHNLGAHHDVFTHVTRNGSDTIDTYARGWINTTTKVATLMAYDDLCEVAKFECTQIPFYSNPLNSYGGGINGDPAPGQQPNYYFGPANNVMAMNRMKQTVSNYKRKFPTF